MKRFNCLNSVAILVVLIAVADALAMQCPDQKENRDSRKADLESKLFGSWIGVSVGSFISKEIFHHLSAKYPVKKEHYLKYARYSCIGSRCAAIPVISVMTYVAMMAVGMGFCWPDPIKQQLPVVAKLSTVPYQIMVSKPVQAYEYLRYQQKIKAEKRSQ